MKSFAITLAVLAVLGCLCCGGLFIAGRNGLKAGMTGLEEAKVFARDSIMTIGSKWDPKELRKRVSPGYAAEFSDSDDVVRLRTLALKLGSIKRVGQFEVGSFNLTNSTLRIQLATKIVTEKGEARVQLKLVKSADIWKIDGWLIDPYASSNESPGKITV